VFDLARERMNCKSALCHQVDYTKSPIAKKSELKQGDNTGRSWPNALSRTGEKDLRSLANHIDLEHEAALLGQEWIHSTLARVLIDIQLPQFGI
jgi:hypothetical protein